MATLSAMYAQLLSILADHRPADAWVVAIEHMQALNELTQTAEKGWTNNPLAAVEDESSLGECESAMRDPPLKVLQS